MWLLIVLVARLGGSGSDGFVHDAVTRFMGLIVIAMGFNLRCRECDHSTQNVCCAPGRCNNSVGVDSEHEIVDGQSPLIISCSLSITFWVWRMVRFCLAAFSQSCAMTIATRLSVSLVDRQCWRPCSSRKNAVQIFDPRRLIIVAINYG